MRKFDFKWIIIFIIFSLFVSYIIFERLREGVGPAFFNYSLDFSPDGKKIATVPVGIWDVEKGGIMYWIKTEYRPDRVRWSPDGNYIAFTSDEELHLYDVSAKQFIFSDKFRNKYDSLSIMKGCFSPDGNVYAYPCELESGEIEIKLFDFNKLKVTEKIRGFRPVRRLVLTAVDFDDENSWLVTGTVTSKKQPLFGVDAIRDFDRFVSLLRNPKNEAQRCISDNLSKKTKLLLDSFNERPGVENELLGEIVRDFNRFILREDFGYNERYSAVNDTAQARKIKKTEGYGNEKKESYRLNRRLIESVYPDDILPSNQTSLTLWNVKDKIVKKVIPIDGHLASEIYSAKDRIFYFTRKDWKSLSSFNLSNGEHKLYLKDMIDKHYPESTDISKDGKLIGTLYNDIWVKVFDIEKNKLLWNERAIRGRGRSLKFSPDGETLAVGSISIRKEIYEKGELIILNARSGKSIKNLSK